MRTLSFAALSALILASGCSSLLKKKSSSSSAQSDDPSAPPPVVQGLQLNYERISLQQCNPLQVRFIDTSGDYFFLNADEVVRVSTTAGNLFSDGPCTVPATSVTIKQDDCCSNDNVSGNLFLKVDSVGSGSLTLNDGGTLGVAPLSVSFSSYLIAGFTISGPAALAANSCGEYIGTTVLGDFKTASPVTTASTVKLSSDSSTATFYSDSACTDTITSVAMASGTSATPPFYFKDTSNSTQSNMSLDIQETQPSDQFASDDIEGYLAVQIGTGTGSGTTASGVSTGTTVATGTSSGS